jgi:hypothetical protein
MIRHALIAIVVVSACIASADAQDAATFDGSWSASASVGASPSTPPSPSAGASASAPHGGRGGHGGMGGAGGGGMGGHGGGRHHGGGASPAAALGASEAEQNDPGLRRLFADRVTITKLAHPDRMRFDDGTHAIELPLDGMNVSGPAVGGTVALSATRPDLVVESVTTSGYAVTERYALADDGTHLELHASLTKPGANDAREIARVFDRAPPKSAPLSKPDDAAAKPADATTK